MTTHAIDRLNAWSPTWADAMTRSLIEGSATLIVLGLIWLVARRRMSAGFAHGLFLLVLIKTVASAVSPWVVSVPIPALQSMNIASPVTRAADSAPIPPTRIDAPPQTEWTENLEIANEPPASQPAFTDVPPRLSRTSWLMLTWGTIVVGLLTRFLACNIRAGRRLITANEVDPASLPVDPDRLARLAGLRRRVPLLHSDLVRAPAVWGLWRPRILIPEGMLDGLSREQLTWILLHEFAHIARKDTWVALAQRSIQILFFFHPSVWVANRLADVQREFACDEIALALADVTRRDCGEGFLIIAERASRPSPALSPIMLGLFGSSTLIRRRLEHLLDDALKPSARLSRSALALLLVGVIIAASRVQAQAPAPAITSRQPKPAAAESGERMMDVTVVDSRTGKPMPGVAIETEWEAGKRDGKTDEAGRYVVTIPKGAEIYLGVQASKEGFVSASDQWRLQGATAKAPPETLTFSMEPGTTISGVIQDEQGRPIAGATAFVLDLTPLRDGTGTNFFEYTVTTDASGRWKCDNIPADADKARVAVRLAHPDYISDSYQIDSPPPLMAQLRDGSRVMVMKKGLPVSGVVTDPKGKPIAGAEVAMGKNRGAIGNPTTSTDAKGEFRFAHVAPGDLILVTQARGHAPEMKTVKVELGMLPVEFSLEPPHSIHGRIVDAAGKPIPGALVTADGWRGHRRALVIKVVTDAEGKFQLDDLPESPVEFQFSKEGFMSLPNQALAPSDQDVVITMNRPLVISGTVTDAATGKPIDDFTLYEGIDPTRGRPYWDRDSARRFQNGRFTINSRWPVPKVKGLRIEADGYLPSDSRPFSITEGTVVYDFRLTKGTVPTWPAISGVVLLPDGKPAAGANVALANETFGPIVSNGRESDHRDYPHVVTGPDGSFKFPPQVRESFVMVFHDQGYAEIDEVDLAAAPSRTLTLRKWGRVEGTLRIGTKPAADEQVTLNPRQPELSRPPWMYRFAFHYRATTDRMGRFVFDRVLPGQVKVARIVKVSPNAWMSCNFQTVEVMPGATARIKIGGTGRPVIGRFTKPEEADLAVDWTRTRQFLRLKPPTFKQPQGATKEERAESYRKWLETDEGKAYQAWQKDPRQYGFRIEDDGSFRIDDVTAGIYELSLIVQDSPANGRKSLAKVDRTIVVPEMEGGQSVEPLDLGTIEIIPAE